MNRLLLIISVLGLSACGLRQDLNSTSTAVSPEEAVVESGMGAVASLGDDQSGESFVAATPSAKPAEALCGRAVFAACSAGVRRADLTDCHPVNGWGSINGFIQLTYSQSGCSLSTNGDVVDRTYDLNFEGPHGGVASVKSGNQADYRGVTFGGGGELTKTASGYSISLLGKHIAVSFRGRDLYRTSIRTLSPLSVNGTLARFGREIDGGQLEVNHNLLGFTALFTPHNVKWQSGCCYPVSGSLDVTYTGSRTGSASVTFNGCGQANYNDGVQARDIALSYCE